MLRISLLLAIPVLCAVALPQPQQKTGPLPPRRISVNPAAQEKNLVQRVEPEYPAAAAEAKVRGVVRLTVVIDVEGKPLEVKPAFGDPLLEKPAIEAVKQWRWKPTLLNGVPVEVITQVVLQMPAPEKPPAKTPNPPKKEP